MMLAQTTLPTDGGFWKQAWDTVVSALMTWFGSAVQWLTQHAAKQGKAILEGMVEQLDWTGMDGYLGALTSKAEQINFFFPVYETIAMMSWLMGFWAVVKTMRWLVKFIPFVGG